MKYGLLYLCILLLAACVDEPHTTPVVLPEFKGKDKAQKLNEGRIVFQRNCVDCHNPIKDATGPAMISVMYNRGYEWIDTFFNHRRLFKPDSSYRARVKTYGFSCPEINLSSSELEALYIYIKRTNVCTLPANEN